MGYTTRFAGELKFTREPTATELAFVQSLFDIDETDAVRMGLKQTKGRISYVQFCFTKGFDGIEWDGSEKFYNAVEAVNFIIENVRERFPDLGLRGTLIAQGEEIDDRWALTIGDDGWASKEKQVVLGARVVCPDCGHKFIVDCQL